MFFIVSNWGINAKYPNLDEMGKTFSANNLETKVDPVTSY